MKTEKRRVLVLRRYNMNGIFQMQGDITIYAIYSNGKSLIVEERILCFVFVPSIVEE
jgi:hypothetical protein